MIRAIIASTIVLGLAGLAATLAHRASASLRHAIWLVALVTAVGVGALAAIGPVIEVESTLVNASGVVPFSSDFAQPVRDLAPAVVTPSTPAFETVAGPGVSLEISDFLLAAWLLGVVVIVGRAIAGHVGAGRLIGRARHLDVDRRLQVDGDIDVLLSAEIDAPFTLGARRPVILLPAEAETWNDERLSIVLVHEAAHVERRDYVAQLVATIACAIYWFNPITWLAASRLRAEAEHAADDRVLAAGVDGVTYASHLLELARPATGALPTAMAVGMARGNRLERRFTAMLDSTRSRGIVPLRFQAVAGSVAMLAAVPFTAMRLVPVSHPLAAVPVSTPALIVPAPAAEAYPMPVARPAPVATIARVRPQGADTIIDRTLAASAGESISISLRSGGSVSVRAWDQPQVRVRGVLSGTQARETRVIFERVGRGLELRTIVDEQQRNTRNSNSFELWVPRRFDVSISSGGGEIMISGVEGRFTGNTGGGEIRLTDVSGYASLTTGGGEVHVTNSNLEGHVTTGGGEAIISNTTGGINVSSGSGPVIRADGQARSYGVGGLATTTPKTVAVWPEPAVGSKPMIVVDGAVVSSGAVSFSRAGGDITLDAIPNGGTFTTGGGEISIGSVGGAASFTTGGGDIRIGGATDDISATTGAGSVEISIVNGNGAARNVSVTSGSGRVVIDVPANLDVRFDLETAYTERHGRTSIQSDFPLNVVETEEWDSRNGTPRRYVRGTGGIGAGRGVIRVRTVNGDVIIRRR